MRVENLTWMYKTTIKEMMVNYKKSALFLHCPKVASVSIRIILENCGFQKVKLGEYPDFINNFDKTKLKIQNTLKYNSSLFTFSFVRNPWDRVVSAYEYLNRSISISFKDFIFSDFVNPDVKWHYGITQFDIIGDGDSTPLVDFIGRFERLQEDFNRVCKIIGIRPVLLPYKNKSIHKHYSEYYDDTLKEVVDKLYYKDIKIFSYNYEDIYEDTWEQLCKKYNYVPITK